MKMIFRTIGVLILLGAISAVFVYREMSYGTGDADEPRTIVIPEGTSTMRIGALLVDEQLVAHQWLWKMYIALHADMPGLKAGVYEIAPHLTISDIVTILATGQTVRRERVVTVPEGWTNTRIAARLTESGFDGDAFAAFITAPPSDFIAAHDVLTDLPSGASLEGYLFPDTYFILPEATPRAIADMMITTFQRRLDASVVARAVADGRTLHEVVTMASIVEREAREDRDRPVMAGVFYNRLAIGMTLGSDATLDYIFGESKIKHTIKETQVDSPYNTYKYAGLPPGPISNPGLAALIATIDYTDTDYMYFLNNATTGKTVYARTFDEHIANKAANGL